MLTIFFSDYLFKVLLIGNLGRDPETRYAQGGGAVTRFSIATSESWRDRASGESQERTEWHNVVCFGRLAEIAGEYLRKGSKVYVEGQLQTRKWTDSAGVEKYSTEVVLTKFRGELTLLDGKKADHDPDTGEVSDELAARIRKVVPKGVLDDEIPF